MVKIRGHSNSSFHRVPPNKLDTSRNGGRGCTKHFPRILPNSFQIKRQDSEVEEEALNFPLLKAKWQRLQEKDREGVFTPFQKIPPSHPILSSLTNQPRKLAASDKTNHHILKPPPSLPPCQDHLKLWVSSVHNWLSTQPPKAAAAAVTANCISLCMQSGCKVSQKTPAQNINQEREKKCTFEQPPEGQQSWTPSLSCWSTWCRTGSRGQWATQGGIATAGSGSQCWIPPEEVL